MKAEFKYKVAAIIIYLMLPRFELFADDLNLISLDSVIKEGVPRTSEENFFSTHFSKYVYTYYLKNLSNLNINTEFGKFRFQQDYYGSYLKIEGLPTRDDENWQFDYEKPLTPGLNLLFRQNWHFTSDSREIGINQLMRLNGKVGFGYSPFESTDLHFLYGLENNKQLSLKSTGNVFSFGGNSEHSNLGNFGINSAFNGNILNLTDGRSDRNLNGRVFLRGTFEDSSDFEFAFLYRNLKNNLLGYIGQSGILPIETRNENNIDASIRIGYQVIQPVKISFDLRFLSFDVERDFKEKIMESPYSYFRRSISQQELAGIVGLDFRQKSFISTTNFGFSTRTENNNLKDKFAGGDSDKYTAVEALRDNQSGKVNFFTNATYFVSRNTFFNATFYTQLLRYDTPSENNFDDRDELNSIINLKFSHRFSNYLNLMLEFENRRNHLVYIFAERSGLNNWNKVYRFSPQLSYNLGNFSLNPRLEVLANYTIYDYTGSGGSLSSISFRQISYFDSMFVKISDILSLHSEWKGKYNERGILYWDNFSESPQNGNYEIFLKSIIRRNYLNDVWIGAGVNYYRYSQISLNNNSQLYYNLESVSPEISFNYVYKKWTVSVSGWYEFQTIKSSIKNQITNLSINVNLLF